MPFDALEALEIRGARHHNLQIDYLLLPKNRLVVFTGVSGSGKSSLAFDTIFAEGQRRYVESLSSYARQFLGQMQKPHVEHLRGLAPTIAIEQKSSGSNPRSTVGTVTEIADHLRLLYARIGVQYCPMCGRHVLPMTSAQVADRLAQSNGLVWLMAPLFEQKKGEFVDVLANLRERGFSRVRLDGELLSLADPIKIDKKKKHTLQLVVDRFVPKKTERQRLLDSIETTFREGNEHLLVRLEDASELHFSRARACPHCMIGLPELTPQLFSFNSPIGLCDACNGLGRQQQPDPALLIPDENLSLREGAIAPFASVLTKGSGVSFATFKAACSAFGIDMQKPWKKLSREQQHVILHGAGAQTLKVSWEGSRGKASWDMTFEGVIPLLLRRYLETKSAPMREMYQKWFSDVVCTKCLGNRLRPEARAVKIGEVAIHELSSLNVMAVDDHLAQLVLTPYEHTIADELISHIRRKLSFLISVGLSYLSLDRGSPTLSGGESQRIRLASQLGSELSGVIYVLDEPSIGLHPRDNEKLIDTLKKLRDAGNSVIVVEHDRDTIMSADHVVDFGPGAGKIGGHVTFEGPPKELAQSDCLTGQYLSGRLSVDEPRKRAKPRAFITLAGARAHNLQSVHARIPTGVFCTITGVSGAGKSSLVTGTLYPALRKFTDATSDDTRAGPYDSLDVPEKLAPIVFIDQSPIGRTPRSNTATYTKLFDLIREVFANLPVARTLGFSASRFSFNVAGGRCEDCGGDGVKRVEMQFLPDVYVTCEACNGRRYNEATLQVRYRDKSISDVLEMTVDEARALFANYHKIERILATLVEVGLSYVTLGQPATTLSGGEAQRIKLARELARIDTGSALYLLDEPTTGLHFDDIRKLLGVLHRLVDHGNTVLVIEHNLEVMASSDWLIDLGPEGGSAGGRIMVEGTPEHVAKSKNGHTAKALSHYFLSVSGNNRRAML